jgi:hypothetical protein
MQPAVRAYYSLEELWGGQTPSRLRRPAPAKLAASADDATPGE